MPKVVNHDARRRLLAATAAEVIAVRGVENTRLRDVADQAGFSPSIVGHYFRDKDELMQQALVYVDECVAERFARLRNRSINRALETILPLDEQRSMEWRVRINFWGRACTQAELAKTLAQSLVFSQQTMVHILREQIERGVLNNRINVDSNAELLVNATMALSLRVLFEPKNYPRAKVRKKIAALVSRID